MSEPATPLLVLGLGNVLLTDDGVGPVAVERLSHRYSAPDGVRVLDGGTLGLALLHYVEDCETLVIVDAVRAEASPGTLVRLTGEDVGAAVATRLSPHQVGVADLLEGADLLGRKPPTIVLLGIVPESLELGYGLSPLVERAVPDLVKLVVKETASLGFPFKEAA